MKKLKDIKNILKQCKNEIKIKFKVKKIGIFGSYVRYAQEKKSDVDILVDFYGDGINLFEFLELKEYLEKKIGIKVDLVTKAALKPVMGKYIMKEVVFV